jgi:hypothetical protein
MRYAVDTLAGVCSGRSRGSELGENMSIFTGNVTVAIVRLT